MNRKIKAKVNFSVFVIFSLALLKWIKEIQFQNRLQTVKKNEKQKR